jgi:hypothetical protein
MKLSVVMATYNGDRYLEAQLQSIGNQARLPDELIVNDDCSTDDTVGILREFARHALFHVDIRSNASRLGPKGTFAQALTRATGDLVFLSDQDDVWFDAKLAMMEAIALECPGKGCFVNDALFTDALLNPVGTTKMSQIHKAGLPAEAMVMGCCTAFRRSLLDLLLPIPDDERAHDNWLVGTADILGLVERRFMPLQYYRRHGRNVSEFFVNRIQPPTWRERLLGPIGAMARRAAAPGGLAEEQRFLSTASTRLSNRIADVRALVGSGADTMVAAASQRAQLLARRQALRNLPRASRFRSALAMWREGDYRNAGVASAMKDLLVGDRAGEVRQ